MKKIIAFFLLVTITNNLYATEKCPTLEERISFSAISILQGTVIGGPIGLIYGVGMSSWVFDYNEPSCNTLQETPNVTLVEANPVNITTAVENEIPTYKFIESAFLFQKNSSKVDLNNFDKNILTENQVEKIIITGNTCQLGSYPYNYNLGFKRANAVSDYLNSIGINKNKLIIKSDGEKNPISKNLSKNRRVDLNIIFNTK